MYFNKNKFNDNNNNNNNNSSNNYTITRITRPLEAIDFGFI